jgi:hypothetical protein
MAGSLDTAALVVATSLHLEWGSLDLERRGSHLARKHRRSVMTDMRRNTGNSWLLRRPHTIAVRERRGSWTEHTRRWYLNNVSAKMRKSYRTAAASGGAGRAFAQITTTDNNSGPPHFLTPALACCVLHAVLCADQWASWHACAQYCTAPGCSPCTS